MKKIKILLIFIVGFINYNNILAQINPVWATAYTINYPYNISENDMVTDKSGNVYITGYSNDTSFFHAKTVTLMYNSSGQLQWVQEIDSLSYFAKIAIDDSGNVYIAGHTEYNLMTIKYNSQGIFKWAKSYIGSLWYNWVFDIITDDSCNVYITGNSNGNQFTTIKYSSSGDLKWIASDSPAMGLDNSYIALDNNRDVYITVRGIDTSYTCKTMKYNNFGIKQWERVYKGNFNPGSAGPRGLKFDPHGFVYVLAYTTNDNNGEGDYAVVKYDTIGNLVWASSYSFSSYYDVPKSLAIDKSGDVYATGNIYPTGGSIDSIATIKFDKYGAFKWAKTYSIGYDNLDEASAITTDSLGYIYVTGKSSDSSSHENFVTIKYDLLGNEIWVARYKNTLYSSDEANSISLDKFGNIYVSGTSRDYNTSASAILTVKYSFDVGIHELSDNYEYIVKIYPNPSLNNLSIETSQKSIIEILNIQGQLLIQQQIQQGKSDIDISRLAQGVYILRLNSSDKTAVTRFVKE